MDSIHCQSFDLQSKHILEALATARSIQESRSSLEVALVAFDHHDTKVHNTASSAIVLGIRCHQRDETLFRDISSNEEQNSLFGSYMRLTCLLFRCSDDEAINAFHRIGTDLVSSIVSSFAEYQVNAEVSSSIHYLVDRLSKLHVSLSMTERKDLLIRLLRRVIRGEYGCRPLLLVVVHLLSGWTENTDNNRFIMNIPGLVEDVLATVVTKPVGSNLQRVETDHYHDMLPLYVVNLLAHLSVNLRNKSELVHTNGFLMTLHTLMTNSCLRGHNAIVRSIVAILRELATEAPCRVCICKHEHGGILQALLTVDDDELDDAVNHTLLRLIGQDTAAFLRKQQAPIIERLSRTAQLKKSGVELVNDSSLLAAQALKRFSYYVSVRDKSHPDLLNALTSLATSKNWRIRVVAAKGLREQAKSSSGRFYMARTEIALATLINISKFDPCRSVKASATETLLSLALDTANAKRLANNSEVLESFATTALQTNDYLSSARSAIQAILSLTCHRSTNKPRVAKTLGLVEALSRYGVSHDTDKELKRAALHCVIVLAPLM